MANSTIDNLTENTSPALTNLIPVNGTPDAQKASISNVIKLLYPVGAIHISTLSTNPATLFGFGTWTAFGAGRTLISLDSGDTSFDTVEETGGAKTKTIAQANLPNISTGAGTAHTHTQDAHSHVENAPSSASGGALKFGIDTNASGTADAGISTATTVATNQNESAHTHSLGGSGTALDVMNPYIVVYMFKRTA